MRMIFNLGAGILFVLSLMGIISGAFLEEPALKVISFSAGAVGLTCSFILKYLGGEEIANLSGY